ncbi:beta-lactamase family protein [Chryseobacterium salipaludis]|uniref:serine hydrolase domain-containing protein n=1 Tax=Chryseobacterium TaxID=59732 RepID=UPI001FF0F936|nr:MULTISPECIES: serine hydrolase [Chryseobacterium]MCJ8498834.1 beta-lactamase family protein [Chryseobacterium salipaludis]MCX3297772.1 serine hydrolase [Planobacterium sp. JC490]
MKKIFKLIWLAMFFSNVAVAQNQQQRLDSLFTEMNNKKAFNGNVLIAADGKVIFEKSYGLADNRKNIKLTDKSIFNLASITKQFTAAAILLLQGENKLSLADDITRYFPELFFYKGITIDHLIHHTSGLPDYMELMQQKADRKKAVTNKYVIQVLAKEKPALHFSPNDRFEYSNTGYLLLASIIEKISQTSYRTYLKQNIFLPLDMHSTDVFFLYKDKMTVSDVAIGYIEPDVGEDFTSDVPYVRYFDGAYGQGRIYSTAQDLLKWAQALHDHTLFTEEETHVITDNFRLHNNQFTNYGFGVYLSDSKKYGKVMNHSGSWGGYTTFLEQHPANDIVIIFLQNHSLITTKIPIQQVRKILYNEPLVADKPVELKSAELDKYVGYYTNSDIHMKVLITKKDDVLYLQANDQTAIPLQYFGKHAFKFEPDDIALIFNLEKETFELSQGRLQFVFIRE